MAAPENEFKDLELRRKLLDAVEDVKRLLASHDWEQASRMAAILQRDHPQSKDVADLVRDVVRARDPHKDYLTRRFLKAAENQDLEEAMGLLAEMDRMLSRDEAKPILSLAQKVIEKHKQNLMQRFKLAVSQRDWSEAKHVAERIISEFGNTRMAAEVRQHMEMLRRRSRDQQMPAGKS